MHLMLFSLWFFFFRSSRILQPWCSSYWPHQDNSPWERISMRQNVCTHFKLLLLFRYRVVNNINNCSKKHFCHCTCAHLYTCLFVCSQWAGAEDQGENGSSQEKNESGDHRAQRQAESQQRNYQPPEVRDQETRGGWRPQGPLRNGLTKHTHGCDHTAELLGKETNCCDLFSLELN